MSSFLSRAVPRALLQALRPALLLAALSLAGAAHAATDTYNGGDVAGCSYDDASTTYTCATLSSANDITIADGYTVIISSSASITSSQTLTMDGSAALQIGGALSLATSKLALTGGSLSVGGSLALTIGAASPTIDISAATIAINNSDGAVIHGTVTASGALAFQSSMRVTGLVTAASISIDMHTDVVANVKTGTLYVGKQSSLSGNVSASGDVTIDNHASVYGNLTGHNVVLKNACAYISGNATVTAIDIGAQGLVGGSITCASGNSCVTSKSHGNPNACSRGGGGPVTDLDHILISHPGTALTCEPQTVTLTACADAACSAYYTDPVDVTLSPGGATFTVTGGSGSGTVQQSTAGSATLSASAAEANNANTCYNTVTGSSSCTMVFSDAGFSFTIPDHRAEQVQSFTLRALKAGSGGNVCVPLLANVTHNVTFNCNYTNPASGTVPARVNGTALAASASSACSAGGAVVALPFDASGTASATLQYADAGRMTLSAQLNPPSGPYAGLVLKGAASFTAAPASFRFTVTAASNSALNPAATNDTGPVFIGAGQDFHTRLEALNSANAVTANFGNESLAESYTLAQSLVAPAGGHMMAVAGSLPAMVNGVASTQSPSPPTPMHWDEVGIIKFAATLANANGYLNSGLGVTGSTNIGRFIPDHFDTALNGTVPMTCPVNPAFGTPCPAPNASGKFVYAAQPFDLRVTAYNKSGVTTQNYEGLYAKAVALAAYNGVGASGAGNQNPPIPPGGNSLNPAAVAAARFAKGVATADPASLPAYLFAYSYPATSAQLAPPTNIWLRATDTDGATSLRGASSNEALVSVVSGRLSVANSYGSEALPMPVMVQAQYWGGATIGWVNNPAYANATAVALTGLVTFSNCQKNLANSGSNTCAVTFTLANDKLTFTGGSGKFTVAAPGKSGAVDITLSKGGTQAIPYLPSTTGRATFGVYRAGPVVYLREVY
ncbi:polymer-forming cytoskeletal protein [Duganella sp. LX20W]|uniref:Polymer-forming cytoskeletal protein n=1 Tax=Rugamonas brunnea TaxID=2758569 RepID=A0A7W2IED6_9BURK|nr:polymer-forming cytoskeletal protein [Rugamonas brunnea]MBA5640215.1 polymer-forming cytoskeletal protein [Rugamonas brunnea]